MKLSRILLISFLALFGLSFSASRVLAVEDSFFPSCVNPQGIVQASYGTGLHGVPAVDDRFTGADTVYAFSTTKYTQCLCADSGQGIQTNWWKASSLSEDQVAELKTDGWTLIPNGADWGLEDAAYYTKSGSFSCGSGGNGGEGSSSSSGSVLGLASTGNIVFIYSIFILGTTLVAFGSILLLTKKK